MLIELTVYDHENRTDRREIGLFQNLYFDKEETGLTVIETTGRKYALLAPSEVSNIIAYNIAENARKHFECIRISGRAMLYSDVYRFSKVYFKRGYDNYSDAIIDYFGGEINYSVI